MALALSANKGPAGLLFGTQERYQPMFNQCQSVCPETRDGRDVFRRDGMPQCLQKVLSCYMKAQEWRWIVKKCWLSPIQSLFKNVYIKKDILFNIYSRYMYKTYLKNAAPIFAHVWNFREKNTSFLCKIIQFLIILFNNFAIYYC